MRAFAYYKKRKDDNYWLTKQIRVLSHFEIDEVVIEEADRYQEFHKLLNRFKKNDTLVLYKLSVLELKQAELVSFIERLEKLDMRLIIESNRIDTSESNRTNFFSDCKLIIQTQSEITRYLTKRSLEQAHEKGVVLGRPKLAIDTVETIRYFRENKKMSIREIAQKCNVSIGTVHKYISYSANDNEDSFEVEKDGL